MPASAASRFRSPGAVLIAALAFTLLAAAFARPAAAVEIQRFRTAAGINVWLVEENTVPLITFNFAWRGGAAQDPAGRPALPIS